MDDVRSVLRDLLAHSKLPRCRWLAITGGEQCVSIGTRVYNDGFLPWEVCDKHADAMPNAKDLPHADVVRKAIALVDEKDGG